MVLRYETAPMASLETLQKVCSSRLWTTVDGAIV